jgi:hypothetical protein
LFVADPSEFSDSIFANMCPPTANASPKALRSVPPPEEWQMLHRAPLVDHEGADVPIATLLPVVEVGYVVLNSVRYELSARVGVDTIDIAAASNAPAITCNPGLVLTFRSPCVALSSVTLDY